jgi:hypothetical protein
MGNHFHLLIETPDANLSRGMQHLNSVYTQGFNFRHQRAGHLFQGRFKAILVERESYLLELCRYIALNPVRAGMVDRPDRYMWSSYNATAGLTKSAPWLSTNWLLSQFGSRLVNAQKAYAKFVAQGIGKDSPWSKLHAQVLLGSPAFIAEMTPRIDEKEALSEVPRTQRFLTRPTLDNLLDPISLNEKSMRDQQIRLAYQEHGYRMIEISQNIGLHYSTVSRIINSVRRAQ